jgi:FixJ family two-component response regulator
VSPAEAISCLDSALQIRSQHKVYVVDDDDGVRDSMCAVLQSMGLDVSEYPSAGDFLARVRAPENACMLLDVHMPGMSGLELLELMRQRGWDIPVILVMGRSDDALKQRASRAGVFALLDKPVDEATLVQALDGALASISDAQGA